MYNLNPKGQQSRPTYNMLFSHFKQLGFTDELAGIEANKLMNQPNSFNQHSNVQGNNSQYTLNMYLNTNYNPPGYTFNPNVFNKQVQPIHCINPPKIKQSFNLSFESRNTQANYDTNNLLSGVKISSKATPGFPNPQQNDPLNPFKTQSRPPLDPKTLAEIFDIDPLQSPRSNPEHPITLLFQKPNPLPNPCIIGHESTPKYPMAKSLPGYSVNQPPPPSYPYKSSVGAVPQPNVKYPGIMPKTPPNLSSIFYIDTKGATTNKNKQNEDNGPLNIGQVNKWIQDLYMHLNMTTCPKTLRKAVNIYIQHIMEKFRTGTLTMNELKMLSPEEIMNFKPTKVEPSQEIQQMKPKQDLNSDFEAKNVLHPSTTRFKPKVNKTPNIYKILQNQINDYLSVPLDQNEIQRREQRSHRFKNTNTQPTYNFNRVKGKKIVGLSQDLEKQYLRLTSAPNPLIVRPEPVLIKSFRYVFDKFLRNKNYLYIQEQFRSIRQDIQVYTTNARLAMLHNDLDQFNQCQTQLKHLLVNFNDCQQLQFEFELYYTLYLSLQNMSMGLLRYLKDNYLNNPGKSNSKVENQFKSTIYFKFANLVRISISEGNFIQYFKLANTKNIDYDYYLNRIYRQAFDTKKTKEIKSKPKNCYDIDAFFYVKLLFKMFENKSRMFSLYTLCKGSLTLSIKLLTNLLNFSSEDECLRFLKKHKVTFNSPKLVDCKRSLDIIASSPLMRSKKI